MENRAKAGVVLAAIMFATAAPIIRWSGKDVSMLAIAFYRMFFATLAWLPFYLQFKIRNKSTSRLDIRQKVLIIVAGIFLGFHFAAWTSSLAYTTVASATFIMLSQPLFAAIAAHFIIHERLNRWNVLAIILTITGSVVIFQGDINFGRNYFKGDMLALTGAIASTAYLFIARVLRPDRSGSKYSGIKLVTYLPPVYAIATVVLLIFNLIAGTELLSFSWDIWTIFILLGLIPTFIGHSLFNWAVRYLPAFSVNIGVIGEPIGASILVFFLFNEIPSRGLMIGAPVMILSVLLVFIFPPESGTNDIKG